MKGDDVDTRVRAAFLRAFEEEGSSFEARVRAVVTLVDETEREALQRAVDTIMACKPATVQPTPVTIALQEAGMRVRALR